MGKHCAFADALLSLHGQKSKMSCPSKEKGGKIGISNPDLISKSNADDNVQEGGDLLRQGIFSGSICGIDLTTFMKRFLFLAVAAIMLPCLVQAGDSPANAFGKLKQKLEAGKNAVIFINGDSTAYSEDGPYYKFAKKIGEETNSKVVLYRWAEWDVSKPTGPKEYAPPVVLHEGSGPATLTVYLAALPGSGAGDMFAESRRAKAIDAIPQPDCAILHQGHNMRSFPRAFPEDGSSIRGLFLSAIGNTADKWPGVSQSIVTQNPWRDSDKFQPVYNAICEVAALQPNVELIDSYKSFIEAGKQPDLYRDDIHPSDRETNSAGAELVSDALMSAWKAAKPNDPAERKAWSEVAGDNLIINGDFSDWTEEGPAGWRATEGATAEQVVVDGKPAIAIRPNGRQAAILDKNFTEDEVLNLTGKTISVAALVRADPSQPKAVASLVCKIDGETRTFSFGDLNGGKGGWIWMVCSGIPVGGDNARGTFTLRFYPAFGVKPPENNEPLLLRKVIVSEGKLPFGRLSSEDSAKR